MGKPLHVLMVEDSDDDVELLLRALRRGGYDVVYKRVDSLAAMRLALERMEWEVVISDHAMPRFNAPAALALCREMAPRLPFIILSGEMDLNLAVALMKAGAQDYISKRELARLAPAIERELAEAEVRRAQERAEADLSHAKERIERILESLDDGFFVLDREFRFTYFNRAAARLLGRQRNEVLGRPLFAAFPEARGAVFEERFLRALREGRPDAFEVHFDVAPYRNWYEVQVNPFEDGISVCFRVTTARKQAEEALRRERDLVERIMETSPSGIVTLNREGQITFANLQAERVLGLRKDQITQRAYNAPEWHITDFEGRPFPPEELPFARVMREGYSAMDVCHAIDWPDGRRVFLSINGAPLFDEAGQVDGVIAVVQDVTEQVRTSRRLEAERDRAQKTLDVAQVMLLALNRSGEITLANRKAGEVLGYNEGELRGKNWFDSCLPASVRHRVRETFELLMAGRLEVAEHFENPVLTSAGEERRILWRNTLLRDEDGRIVGTLSSGQEVAPGERIAPGEEVGAQTRESAG